jgi:hypothetical protein
MMSNGSPLRMIRLIARQAEKSEGEGARVMLMEWTALSGNVFNSLMKRSSALSGE